MSSMVSESARAAEGLNPRLRELSPLKGLKDQTGFGLWDWRQSPARSAREMEAAAPSLGGSAAPII